MMTQRYADAKDYADIAIPTKQERAYFLRGTYRLLTNVSAKNDE